LVVDKPDSKRVYYEAASISCVACDKVFISGQSTLTGETTMTTSENKVPVLFWIISAVLLAWNALGVMAYLADVNQTPEALAALDPAMRAIYESRPAWAIGAFAIAVFGGFVASILLLMRRKLATKVFILSLASVLVQQLYSFGIARVQDASTENVMILPAVIVVVGIFSIWYSRSCETKGLLN